MKKVLISVLCSFICVAAVSAYNPPAGGQKLYNLSSPTLLSGGNSAAGTGIFNSTPESIVINPALPSYEQRVQLDAGFTALCSTKEDSVPFNAAFQTGILIPNNWGIFTGILDGVFCNADEMNLADSFNIKAGVSKEITQKICVGINLSGGYLWGAGSDWSLGADLGALYRRESLGFMKDFRIGVSIMNLGKPYSAELAGIDEKTEADWFPSIASVNCGVAALFLDTKPLKIGMSLNANIPTFQNGIFDAGIQFGIKDIVFVNVAETLDIKEIIQGHENFMPAIGVSVKFTIDSKNSSYLKAHDWDKSEVTTSLAWQQKYETIQAISGGINMKLGMQDNKPPVIDLWIE